jgi:4-amino-4-deoxy-L-arabinose transferase-like glycosyltransferase
MFFRLPSPRKLLLEAKLHPGRAFWIFAFTHLVLWTAVSSLTSPNAPLDVIEGYAWGHEWPLGTYKHPPMQAWILQILAVVTDRAPWAHFLASQLAVITAFWAVWQTARRITDETAALVSVLLLEGIIYYNFTSTEFNPNLLQLPFWALIGWSFHRAVKDNRLTDWLLLGLWSAGGLYSKYSTALLLGCLGVLMISHPQPRRRLNNMGPYLAFLTAFILFLPHLLWLFEHNFLPFIYASHQLTEPEVHRYFIPKYILSPLFLLSGQFLALLFFTLLFLVLSAGDVSRESQEADSFDLSFIKFVTEGPFFLTFLTAIFMGFRVHDMWCTPFWNFVGLWGVIRFHPVLSARTLTRFMWAGSLVFFSALLIYAGNNILYAYVASRPQRVQFPGHKLATRITDEWHSHYNIPLRFVIGDVWPAGNAAYYSKDWPSTFISGDAEANPSINFADVKKAGGVIVWCARYCVGEPSVDIPNFVREKFSGAQIQEPFSLPRQTGAAVKPVKIGWAILAPEGNNSPTKKQ